MTREEMLALREQGKTYQEIADMCGCSRQNVHEILKRQPKRKMKAPSKSELCEQVKALTRENVALLERLNAEEKKRWLELQDKAFEIFFTSVPFPRSMMCYVTLMHVDKAGYWFSFELINDDRKQTYCVRHTDFSRQRR